MKRSVFIYLCLLGGAILQGMAMSLFLFPHSIPSGGAAGIAILLNHFFDLPLGFSLWLANIVFLLFALNYFGYTWTLRTIFSVATTSTTVSYFTSHIPHLHVHLLLDLAAGSIFFGFGVAILIRAGASSGGMVIPALMIASYKNWRPGKVMMWINFIIFILTALVINYKIVVFAVICQYFSTSIIDYIYKLRFNQIPFIAYGLRKIK
ncbi:YitT family protein [Bacillus marasmi]|uniref:YitT family protein n=1 Tax=Bacillus marasmi TaxID=1926279 RepID=UPI0011C7A579|nr:YitT family protein [Bacillus marasmi]